MPKRLHSLSGLDAAFLYLEAAGTPMHVGSVMLLHVPKRRGADFRRDLIALVQQRLPRAAPLRRLLREAPFELGHPLWQEAAGVDLERHITRLRLPAPGSREQLWRTIGELHAAALPRDRPLWQFTVIEGLAGGEVALYTKIHHALLDGQGGVALGQALLDAHPGAPPRAAHRRGAAGTAAPRPQDLAATSLRAGVQQFARLVRAVPMTLKLAGDALLAAPGLLGRLRSSVSLAPRTLFNGQVGPRRSFAVASLPLQQVKQVARHYGASLNDVVLTLCAGSLRDYLRRRQALPDATLIAAMPVSLRAAGDNAVNNQVSMVQCALATDVAAPVARLRAIAAATGQLKRQVSTLRGLIPTDFPGLAAPIWATGLSRLWARGRIAERLPPLANLAISNVPGPPLPLYLAGAKVLHYFPVSIVTHGLGLNITVNSYAGALEFGLVACKDMAPRLDTLAKGLGRGLDALTARMRAEKMHK